MIIIIIMKFYFRFFKKNNKISVQIEIRYALVLEDNYNTILLLLFYKIKRVLVWGFYFFIFT